MVCAALASSLFAPFVRTEAIVIGLGIGVVLSPLVVLCLRRKALCIALPACLVSPALASLLGGLAESILCIMLSIPVFIGSLWTGWLLFSDKPTDCPPGICRKCGYDKGSAKICPECGCQHDTIETPPSVITRIGYKRIIACGVIASCLVAPLGTAAWCAYDRYRPKSIAHLIGQLGDNDMHLQWEARTELVRRRAGKELTNALGHTNPGVRLNAAWALESLPDVGAKSALTKAIDDPDPYVREHARRAFDKARN